MSGEYRKPKLHEVVKSVGDDLVRHLGERMHEECCHAEDLDDEAERWIDETLPFLDVVLNYHRAIALVAEISDIDEYDSMTPGMDFQKKAGAMVELYLRGKVTSIWQDWRDDRTVEAELEGVDG